MHVRGYRIVLITLCGLAACTLTPVRRGPPPEAYPGASAPAPAFPNWPIHPEKLEPLLMRDDYVIESMKPVGSGTTGAMKAKLSFPGEDVTVAVKWKPMSARGNPLTGELDGINNSPRKELASWTLQRMFLDPHDYVVPTTLTFCVPVDRLRPFQSDAKPTLQHTNCVLGVIALWLQDLTLPEPLLDTERFNRDYVYAYFLSNLNLLTYLVKHHDGREGNFLASNDDSRRQVFAIDNGVAFGGIWYNWFVPNWNAIRVPAFRKASVDRLRVLSKGDLEAQLGVAAQLELDDAGIYRNVPPTENLSPTRGVRMSGQTLQFGLTRTEIDGVWDRVEDLLEDVDDGDVAAF